MCRCGMIVLVLAIGQAGCGEDLPPGDDLTGDDTTAETDPSDTPAAGGWCGDGIVQAPESCDAGEANGQEGCGCQSTCTWASVTTACDDALPCTELDHCDGVGRCLGVIRTCDDQDACTDDRCEPDGTCLNERWSGDPLALFDLDLLRDPSTLDVDTLSSEVVWEGLTRVEVREIRFTSYESEACELRPVRLEGWLALPADDVGTSGRLPGLAVAHGLGAWAEAGSASNPAGQLGAAVLAWSGPGQGDSEGTGSTPDHLFDVLHSPRDCWFWEHEAAAIRALTVLGTLQEVDADRLGISGYSGGALATLVVNGVDDRVKAAFPTSATGWLELAIRNPTPGWELDLLKGMSPPRDADSPEWAAWEASMDPRHFLATSHGAVFLNDGAQDEFFPIDAAVRTFQDLQATGGDHRILSVVNWDHGWFALFTGEAAAVTIDQAFTYWFRHHFGLGAAYQELPPVPALVGVYPGLCSGFGCAMAVVDLPPNGFDVTGAWIHFSTDGLGYLTAELEHGALGWTGGIPLTDPTTLRQDTAVWIAEFELQAGLFGPKVRVTSVPSLPPGFQPVLLGIAGPLPL